MPLLWMPCKSFYGRLSSILNNCDRGKTVTFNGLIHEICYAVPAEWVEPLYRTTAFHGLKSAGIIHTEVSIFCIMSRSGADFSIVCFGGERIGYPLLGTVTDCRGADIIRYKCHATVRFDRTAPQKTAPRVYFHSVHIAEFFPFWTGPVIFANDVFGTVPVWMSYRTYRSIRYRY